MSLDSNKPFFDSFESKSSDEGIRFIENKLKRRMETLDENDVIGVLRLVAVNGNPEDKTQNKVEFLRTLLSGELALRTTSEHRKENLSHGGPSQHKKRPNRFLVDKPFPLCNDY